MEESYHQFIRRTTFTNQFHHRFEILGDFFETTRATRGEGGFTPRLQWIEVIDCWEVIIEPWADSACNPIMEWRKRNLERKGNQDRWSRAADLDQNGWDGPSWVQLIDYVTVVRRAWRTGNSHLLFRANRGKCTVSRMVYLYHSLAVSTAAKVVGHIEINKDKKRPKIENVTWAPDGYLRTKPQFTRITKRP